MRQLALCEVTKAVPLTPVPCELHQMILLFYSLFYLHSKHARGVGELQAWTRTSCFPAGGWKLEADLYLNMSGFALGLGELFRCLVSVASLQSGY